MSVDGRDRLGTAVISGAARFRFAVDVRIVLLEVYAPLRGNRLIAGVGLGRTGRVVGSSRGGISSSGFLIGACRGPFGRLQLPAGDYRGVDGSSWELLSVVVVARQGFAQVKLTDQK